MCLPGVIYDTNPTSNTHCRAECSYPSVGHFTPGAVLWLPLSTELMAADGRWLRIQFNPVH
jgi:hypothetical protein